MTAKLREILNDPFGSCAYDRREAQAKAPVPAVYSGDLVTSSMRRM